MTGTAWLLALGATYRISLLIVADEITRRPREAALRWLSERGSYKREVPRFAVLITCPWCISVHVGFVVVGTGLAWSSGWGWQLVAGALCASGVTGFAARYASPE